MTTYLTDRHGKRWALVPVELTREQAVAAHVVDLGTPSWDKGRYAAQVAAAPDFEPREPTPKELDRLIPTCLPGHMTDAVHQAMRAAMALIWSTK